MVIAQLSRRKPRADGGGAPGEDAVAILSQRQIGGAGNVYAVDMTIDAGAEIGHIIVAPPCIAQHGGAHRKAVGVVVDAGGLAVAIIDHGELAGEARQQKILPVEIGDKHPIIARAHRHIVEPAVGILL